MPASYNRFPLLPDSMIIFIISLLPFKDAARTCILSKCWLDLWKKSTNIEFNEFFFVKLDSPQEEREAQRMNFLNFVTGWLRNHIGRIEKLFLTLSNPSEATEIVQSCISFAINHKVKALGIDLSDPNWYESEHENPMALFELPAYVYMHEVIESLTLYSCGFLDTEFIKLHSLKDVSFGWIELTNGAINTILSNCKMIENLSMKKCWSPATFDCGSDDLRLRRLLVDSCSFNNVFKLNAPNLTYFEYYGEMNDFKIENSCDIEEADVDFGLEYINIFYEDVFLQKIIRDLHHAKVLTICSYTLQVLTIGRGSRTEYQMNVRNLKIKTNLHNNELIGVSFILNSCPMLESLTFELGLGRLIAVRDEDNDLSSIDSDDDDDDDDDDGGDDDDEDDDDEDDGGDDDEDETSSLQDNNKRNWINNAMVFQCLTSTLKVVEMNNFIGTENEIVLLNYFIYNGSYLKKININVQKDSLDGTEDAAAYNEFYRNIQEKLLVIPRASTALEISFQF